jgi:transcriptional regulator with XRE-family HTH domain
MPPHRLENYLRTHRKRSGLTQEEVAFLLGCEDGSQVSRYEKRRHLPPLETALACEAIFGVPIAELFAGVRQGVEKNIEERRLELRARLQAKPAQHRKARVTAQKLRWLTEHNPSLVETQHATVS